MEKIWTITGWDGSSVSFERNVPGHLTEGEVTTMLQRLVARDLSVDDVIHGSLRKNDAWYAPYFERVGFDMPLSYGPNPHYTAQMEDV